MITVVLPVGPFPNDKKWLDECLVSINQQTYKEHNVILVDDGAKLDPEWIGQYLTHIPFRIHYPPWRIGCADAWNAGVGLGRTDLYFFMGADDWLEIECLESCLEVWERNNRESAYYFVPILYSDTGEEQNLPCNAAMVTRSLWSRIGGFPAEAGLGAPDALVISMMLAQGPARTGRIIGVGNRPLYNVRRHDHQETARKNKYHQQIIDVRNVYSATWEPQAAC